MDFKEVQEISLNQYPKKHCEDVEYGTAGFRSKADELDHTLFRMGIVAVLRSRETNAAIGIMVTASHNKEPDNGVKLVDPQGEMLDESWESIATQVASAHEYKLMNVLRDVVEKRSIDGKKAARVIIGRDTRQSSPALAAAAIAGIEAAGNASHDDYGIVTTPQLHYLVVSTNADKSRGRIDMEEYYSKFVSAFQRLHSKENKNNGKYKNRVKLDAANGVGAMAALEFQHRLEGFLNIEVLNDGYGGALNDKCGADYVKIEQAAPANISMNANERYVSIDGDADRIVYYYVDDSRKFHLLDGDRIATLIASYFKELIEASGLTVQLGVVQTAYANGASTEYITEVLKLPVACAATGVKHLHRRAHDFDIGVYFEANGHGTVVVKESVERNIREAASSEKASPSQREAAVLLGNLIDVTNQYVGDGLSIMLLVESILYHKGWDLATWEQCYTDMPNKQLKVPVKNKVFIRTDPTQNKVTRPVYLQEKIDQLVGLYPKGRAFVRPSGTENIIRVYAECSDPEEVHKLAFQVSRAVHYLVGGVEEEVVSTE